LFKGKPYKNQAEISIFAVILPHFIYSFKFKDKLYINPAISNTENLIESIFGDLNIEQKNFEEKRAKETYFKNGAKTVDQVNYEEI